MNFSVIYISLSRKVILFLVIGELLEINVLFCIFILDDNSLRYLICQQNEEFAQSLLADQSKDLFPMNSQKNEDEENDFVVNIEQTNCQSSRMPESEPRNMVINIHRVKIKEDLIKEFTTNKVI